MTAFLHDRYVSVHFLKPVLDRSPEAFFANGNDIYAQQLWARENGMASQATLQDILLAQIEAHRTETFYNLDPVQFGNAFLKRLPGSVRRTIAWRAAPSGGAAFLDHDVIVNNFPSLLDGYRAQGVRAEYMFPGHDPEMDAYAEREQRPIDVLFVGTYSRYHLARASMLEAIAGLRANMAVAMHLDISRYTRLAETPLGWLGPLRGLRRPRNIRAVTLPPIFGRDLLETLGRSKIVVNGAIDMAGSDRGNMRVWEALGCGAVLVSDRGTYPPGIKNCQQFVEYDDAAEVPAIVASLIGDSARRRMIARAGHQTISTLYSKDAQWRRFQEIAA